MPIFAHNSFTIKPLKIMKTHRLFATLACCVVFMLSGNTSLFAAPTQPNTTIVSDDQTPAEQAAIAEDYYCGQNGRHKTLKNVSNGPHLQLNAKTLKHSIASAFATTLDKA